MCMKKGDKIQGSDINKSRFAHNLLQFYKFYLIEVFFFWNSTTGKKKSVNTAYALTTLRSPFWDYRPQLTGYSIFQCTASQPFLTMARLSLLCIYTPVVLLWSIARPILFAKDRTFILLGTNLHSVWCCHSSAEWTTWKLMQFPTKAFFIGRYQHVSSQWWKFWQVPILEGCVYYLVLLAIFIDQK